MPKTIFTGSNQVVVGALRSARLAMGLTQAQLAARMGRDQSWISLIEGSQRRVDVVEFIEMANALDVDPVALLGEIVGRL